VSHRPLSRLPTRATGLLLGVLADAALGDCPRWHPVAGFGRIAAATERRCYRDRRWAGVGFVLLTAGSVTAAAVSAGRLILRRPAPRLLALSAATWAALGAASLADEAGRLADELMAGDLVAARARLPHLCGRDPAALDAAGLARAGCESMAENTSDAVVAPLLWGALAGLPGLVGYRAVNTLDAMVGYRSPRYRRFGWASARLDDALNLLPARVTAALIVLLAPLVGGSPAGALRAWRGDGRRHPSPNAGPVEAAAAGALGIRLGGLTRYPHGVELRPTLGQGRVPTPGDLRRLVRLCRTAGWLGAGLSVLLAGLLPAGRPGVAARLGAEPWRSWVSRSASVPGLSVALGQPVALRRAGLGGRFGRITLGLSGGASLQQLQPDEVGQPEHGHRAEAQPLPGVGQKRTAVGLR
jgi:adenosylcobinamide-phosphate synthase